MKIFSVHANSETLTREVARGCFSTNLVIPGLGSLVGGRKVGYLQLILCYLGQGITLVFGIQLVYWTLANWAKIYNPNAEDPLAGIRELWPHLRLPLLGIVLFGLAWCWALLTSYLLLGEAKRNAGVE